MAINFRKNEWTWNPWKTSQIVLTAVDSKTNKGWYRKLVNAAILESHNEGAISIFNTTQLANRQVIHVLESTGFETGGYRFVLTT